MFELFETFITIYETKSFTITANNLLITQSTVTKRLKKLENEINRTLFYRKNMKDIIPTAAAHELYPSAINFIEDWKATQDIFHKNSRKTNFKIGITQSSAVNFLPGLINILKDDLNKINLEINIYDSKKILSLVKAKNINLGIIDQNFSDPQITKFDLFKDKLVLAGETSDTIFFLREIKNEIGDLTKKIFIKNNIYFEETISINDYATIINFVKNKRGSTFLPKTLVPENVSIKESPENYLLHYSLIHYYNESNDVINELLLKIKNNVKTLLSDI